MRERWVYKGLKGAATTLIHIYQHSLSLFFGPCCRFFPSCSSYTLESIERFGVFGGINLSLKRLIKCHPFNPGGYDPVPEINRKED